MKTKTGKKKEALPITEAEPLGEISYENSVLFAEQFNFYKWGVHMVDWTYAEKLVPALRSLADTQEVMIIFKPEYPLKKIDAMRLQADALEKLLESVKLFKEVDQLKRDAIAEGKSFEEIQKLFF